MRVNVRAFGEPIDGLILEILDLGGESTLAKPPWNERLWDLWPAWGRSDVKDAQIDGLVEPLTQLRDHLRSQGEERGWETR